MDLVTISREEQGERKANGPGGSLGNAKPDHVDIGEKPRIDRKLVVRFEWAGMRWICGKWKMAVGKNGFISRNPPRSCGGWNVGHGSATRLGHRATSRSHSHVTCYVSAWSTLPAYSPVTPLEIKHRPNLPTTSRPHFSLDSILLGRVHLLETRTDNTAPVLTVRDLDSVESVPTRPVSSGMSFSPAHI